MTGDKVMNSEFFREDWDVKKALIRSYRRTRWQFLRDICGYSFSLLNGKPRSSLFDNFSHVPEGTGPIF